MKLNEPERQTLERQIFLAVGEKCEAMFWPTAGFKERALDNCGFSAEGTLIHVFAVPGCGYSLHESLAVSSSFWETPHSHLYSSQHSA